MGPEEGRLRGVVADLGLRDVVSFRGAIPHDALPQAYADASCLVLASLPTAYWEEQFGMVLAEAMAARLPVIAAASGAIPEVLAGNGTLFQPGDWAGLAAVLAEGPSAIHPELVPTLSPSGCLCFPPRPPRTGWLTPTARCWADEHRRGGCDLAFAGARAGVPASASSAIPSSTSRGSSTMRLSMAPWR